MILVEPTFCCTGFTQPQHHKQRQQWHNRNEFQDSYFQQRAVRLCVALNCQITGEVSLIANMDGAVEHAEGLNDKHRPHQERRQASKNLA